MDTTTTSKNVTGKGKARVSITEVVKGMITLTPELMHVGT